MRGSSGSCPRTELGLQSTTKNKVSTILTKKCENVEQYDCNKDNSEDQEGAGWPCGLERWIGQATGLSRPGSNPTAANFASELWQFRLPRFASVFRRRH